MDKGSEEQRWSDHDLGHSIYAIYPSERTDFIVHAQLPDLTLFH